MKYLFLDTNIFLHFKDFEEIPWNTINGVTDEFCLCVTPTVLDELDDQKDSSRGKIQKRAKKYSKKLFDIFMQAKASRYDIIQIQESTPSQEDANRLDLNKKDNRILLSALKSGYDCNDVIIVSSDRHILLKAHQLGLGHLLMPDEYQLHEEDVVGNVEKKEAISTPLYVPKIQITLGNNSPELSFCRPPIIDEQVKLGEIMDHVKADVPEKHYVEPDSSQGYLSFLSNFPFNSEESVERYNKEREDYLNEEYEYNHILLQKNILDQRFKRLKFEVVNIGQAPSGDMVIVVEFPDSVKLYTTKDSRDCQRVTLPMKPSNNLMLPRDTLRTMASLPYGSGSESIYLWNMDKSIRKHKFTIDLDSLMHNFKQELGLSLYIDTLYESSFTIRWSAQASNSPTMDEGILDVKLDDSIKQ